MPLSAQSRAAVFTAHYSQPEAYHFCQDSVLFPQLVAEYERSHVDEKTKVLDLCAGCGVIGLEFKHYVPQTYAIDFLEIQDEFQVHLRANVDAASCAQSRLLQMSYSQLQKPEFADQYDLILCNPPYFFTHEGRLSPSDFNNRCRFFIDSDFEILIESILHALKPKARAYLLAKDGRHHGRNALRDAQLIISARAVIETLAPVRSTGVLRIIKN